MTPAPEIKRSNRLRPVIAVALAPLAVIAAATTVFDPAESLERHVASAIAADSHMTAASPVTAAPKVAAAEEGSEAFWLGRGAQAEGEKRGIRSVVLEGPFQPRDLVLVGLPGLSGDVYEVVAIAPSAKESTRIDTGTDPDRRFVLTLRPARDPGAPVVAVEVDKTGRGVSLVRDLTRAL